MKSYLIFFALLFVTPIYAEAVAIVNCDFTNYSFSYSSSWGTQQYTSSCGAALALVPKEYFFVSTAASKGVFSYVFSNTAH